MRVVLWVRGSIRQREWSRGVVAQTLPAPTRPPDACRSAPRRQLDDVGCVEVGMAHAHDHRRAPVPDPGIVAAHRDERGLGYRRGRGPDVAGGDVEARDGADGEVAQPEVALGARPRDRPWGIGERDPIDDARVGIDPADGVRPRRIASTDVGRPQPAAAVGQRPEEAVAARHPDRRLERERLGVEPHEARGGIRSRDGEVAVRHPDVAGRVGGRPHGARPPPTTVASPVDGSTRVRIRFPA